MEEFARAARYAASTGTGLVDDLAAQRALAQLTESGVLQEATGRSWNRVWQHAGMLRLLDAYAAGVRREG